MGVALALSRPGDLLLAEADGTVTGKHTTRRGSPAAARARRSAAMLTAESRRTGLPQQRAGVRHAYSSLKWSASSVIVPTVEREVRTGLVWSIAIAGGTPSIRSTCGLSMRSRNWRA